MSARSVFFTVITACILLFTSLVPAYAQGRTNPALTPNTNADVPNNLHYYTQNLFLEIGAALVCQLVGVDPINPSGACLGVDPQTGKIGFVKDGGGAIGMMGTMIASLYAPPVHTRDYVAYMQGNFGVAKPAYAQFTGIRSISPLLNIWIIFRDLVYLLFVIAFIVVGFAIMLRVKIDPRTVMTIENQIPKLIAGLIMVTLSFAIAGVLIDTMWVGTHIVINVISSADPGGISLKQVNNNLGSPPFAFVHDVLGKTNGTSGGGILDMAYNSGLSVQGVVANIFAPSTLSERLRLDDKAAASCTWIDIVCKFGRSTGTIISHAVGWLISWLIGILAMLVIAVAILWALFRTWFALLRAYIFILMDIALSPFWIVSGAVPGGPGVGGWFKDIFSNLVTFPTVVSFLLLGRVFSDHFAAATATSTPFTPPFVGAIDPRNLGSLIGLGFVLMTPVVLERVRKAVGAPDLDLSPINQALGVGSLGGVASGAGGIGQQFYHFNMAKQGFQNLPFGLGKVFGGGGKSAAAH